MRNPLQAMDHRDPTDGMTGMYKMSNSQSRSKSQLRLRPGEAVLASLMLLTVRCTSDTVAVDIAKRLHTSQCDIIVERRETDAVPPRPYSVFVSKVTSRSPKDTICELLIVDYRWRTADLSLLDDSLLLVGMKYSEKTTPHPRVVVPLWKSVAPLELWSGELSEINKDRAHLIQEVAAGGWVAKLFSYSRPAGRFSVGYSSSSEEYPPDIFVLGANAVNLKFKDDYALEITIDWEGRGTLDSLMVLLPGDRGRTRSVIVREKSP